MGILSGIGDFFGLDIGSSAIRVVQIKTSGRQSVLMRYGQKAVDVKTAQSDAPADQKRLIDAIVALVNETGITTRNVAVGVPANRSFVTVADIPKLEEAELRKTVAYQAESFIPQPLNEVKLDWSLLGDSPADRGKVEVLFASVPNDFAESRLNSLEGAGFNVIALEPEALALVRSLTPPATSTPQMILDIGNHATDLVISAAANPKLVRSIPTGGSSFIKAAMQNLNVDEAQAKQFVYKFGLSQDKLEGQVFRALQHTVDSLVSEVDKSVKFFKTRYNQDLEKIVVTGGASTLPEFPLYLANQTHIPVEIGNTWTNVSYPRDRYNELIAVSSQFGVATGLALRVE